MIIYFFSGILYLVLFINKPEFIKKFLIFSFFFTFFVVAFPFLRSGSYNYSAYLALLSIFSLALFLLTNLKIKVDSTFLYLLWYLLSVIINYSLFINFRENYGNYIFPLTAISLYYIFRNYGNVDLVYYLFKVLIISAIAESILGIVQSFFGFPIFPNVQIGFFNDRNYFAYIFPGISELVQQGTGTFEHFNGLGSFLALIFPPIFGWWYANKSKSRMLILLIIFGGVFTTYSRGALLGSIFGVLFILMFLTEKKNRIKIIIFLSVMTIFIFWNIIVKYYEATQDFSVRYYTWTIVWDVAITDPLKLLFGYGVFYFQKNLLGLYQTVTNLHSGQLEIFLELGIVGLSLFITSFIKAVKTAVKSKNVVLISLTGGIIAFFIHQLFDNSLFGGLAALYFVFIAIVITYSENKTIIKIFNIKDQN